MAPGGKRMLVNPLTRSTRAGVPYRRPAIVEAQLYDVLGLGGSDIVRRARITDRSSPEYIRDESLVHLSRAAARDEDVERFTLATETLLRRHARWIRRSVRALGTALQDVDDLCHTVVQALMEAIVADDGRGDFYEVRFRRALKCRLLNVFAEYVHRQSRAERHDSLADPVGGDDEEDGTMREEMLAAGEGAAGDVERRLVIAEALDAIADVRHRERSTYNAPLVSNSSGGCRGPVDRTMPGALNAASP